MTMRIISRWYDIYDNRTANGLVDEALATAALTFDAFEKRIIWLLFSVNAQLVTAEYYAFEGETVNSWKLDRPGLIAMLDALYAPLAKQAKKAAGRTESNAATACVPQRRSDIFSCGSKPK